MSQQEIALLALAIIGGTGLCLIIAAMVIRISTSIKNNSCTDSTYGEVIRHSFPGDGRMAPVIRFQVNGSDYICKKSFNGYKKTVRLPSLEQPGAYEDENGYLCLHRGMMANLKQLALDIWPLGMQMEVHYNPNNPRINYVGRPTTNAFLIKTFSISGIGLIVLGAIMFSIL